MVGNAAAVRTGGAVALPGGRVPLAGHEFAAIVPVRRETSGFPHQRCQGSESADRTASGLVLKGLTKADYASVCLPAVPTTARARV